MFVVLPAGLSDRLRLRAVARRLSAAGAASVQRHLRLARHADRILCRRPAGAGLVLSRRPERHPLDPVDDDRQLRTRRGTGVLLSGARHPAGGLSLCRFLVRSQFGLALAGLRENEQRIAFFGYRVQHLKAIIFSFSGAIAGLAGSLYAFHEGFVWPNMLGVVMSTQVVLYVLVRRRRNADRRGDRHGRGRSRQLLAVQQLSGHLADHPRRAAAAGDHVSPRRVDQPDRQRTRTGRQFRPTAARKHRSRAAMALLEARGIVKIFRQADGAERRRAHRRGK